MTPQLRIAKVVPHAGTAGDILETVKAYLPENYGATLILDPFSDGYDYEREVVLIVGIDAAGWTLTDYVIPRLASGLIFAAEMVPLGLHM